MALEIKNKVAKLNEKPFTEIVSNIRPYGLRGDIFDNPQKYNLSEFSTEKLPNCYQIIGLKNLKRTIFYVPKSFPIPKSGALDKYKIFIPRNYGQGDFGEMPYAPILAEPDTACTETFLEIGPFETKTEMQNCFSYMKTKFFRTLVSLFKHDQSACWRVYQFVPLQDFSKPWTDAELYKKYNLSTEDINFIESKIKN